MAKTVKVRNFMGRGVDGGDDAYVPKYSQGMGNYYGRAFKNPQGTLRDDTLGYIPVSKKRLGTPPKSVV